MLKNFNLILLLCTTLGCKQREAPTPAPSSAPTSDSKPESTDLVSTKKGKISAKNKKDTRQEADATSASEENETEDLSDNVQDDSSEESNSEAYETGEAIGAAIGSIIGAIGTATSSGGGSSGTGIDIATPPAGSSFDTLRNSCLDSINAYRRQVGAPPLTQRTDKGSCVDQQSAQDGASGRAHGSFGSCGESAQNECPGWGGDPGSSQQACLKMMWAEGPGGGHYENMKNPAYRQVACGYANTGGGYWMIQNFY